MGAQACCSVSAAGSIDAFEEIAVAPSDRAVASSAPLPLDVFELEAWEPCKPGTDALSEAAWSEASTALGKESDATSSSGTVSELCKEDEEEAAEQAQAEAEAEAAPLAAEYDTACATISFDPAGPRGLGLLTVAFKAVSLTPDSFSEALRTLAFVTQEHIRANFATIFDISKLVAPSMFVLPKIMGAVKENLVHLESWKEYQQAFAVVRGESSVFNAIVSALGALSRAKNKPIFAKEQQEAVRLLSIQLP